MISLVKEMSSEERVDLLRELYLKGIFHDERFRSLIGVDEKEFMEKLAEYESQAAEEAFEENVSEELLVEMIKEDNDGR